MITCDTSVLVAAFAGWHTAHDAAVSALARVDLLVDHVVVETYSVLTRLPAPHRAPAMLVARFLDHHFPAGIRRLPNPPSAVVVEAALTGGVVGGAVYDLLVGLAASQADATLLSLDRRAVPAYQAAGAGFELLNVA